MIYFGKYLKDYLEYSNISQTEFAMRMGITQKHMNEILNGKSKDVMLSQIENYFLAKDNFKIYKPKYNISDKCINKSVESKSSFKVILFSFFIYFPPYIFHGIYYIMFYVN